MTPRTKVVMFSHITSGLGALLPARELCALARSRGALAIVDGAQAVGQIQVDVQALGCDAYVGSPHKWMLAPKGTGLPVPAARGAGSFLDDAGELPVGQPRRRRFPLHAVRHRQRSRRGRAAGGAALHREESACRGSSAGTRTSRSACATGWRAIPAARIASPADPRLTAAITTFRVDGVKAKALQDALWARRVRVRAQNDERGVRVSTHLYVSPADVDVILDVTRELAARA